MKSLREMSLRVINAGLIALFSAVQRAYANEAIYKLSKDGAAANFEGSWFTYHPSEFGATGNVDFVPEAEDATRRAICSRLKGDETFYDIGAHGGIYTITLQKQFPQLNLHSFEPQPDDLLRNLQLNDLSGARVHKVAVGQNSGTVMMTTKARSSNHVSEYGNKQVPMVRLDDYIEKHEIASPDWIKIDIEGLELAALRGAEKLLRESKPVVICEINHLFDRYGTTIAEFIEFMNSVGLYAHSLIENELTPVIKASSLAELGYSADNNFWFVPR